MRWTIVAALVVVLGLGAGGYWMMTAVDRAVEAATGYPGPSDEDLRILREHAGDPRVLRAVDAFAEGSLRHRDMCRPELLEVIDAARAAQPDASPEWAAWAAAAIVNCKHAAARTWGAFSPETIARGVRTMLREKWHANDNDAAIAWMEEAGVTVSEDSLTALALALGTAPRADAHFARGFPADGAPLGASPTTPPADDPRLVQPVTEALLQYTRLTPNAPGVTPALALVTRSVKVPVSDEIIVAVLRLDREGQAEVARNLFSVDDVERIRAYAQANEAWTIESGALAAVIEGLGAGSDADAQAVFDKLRADVPAEWRPDVREEDKVRRIRAATRTLIEMGARGARSAAANLRDEHPAIREVAVEVLFETDRARFIGLVAAAAPSLAEADLRRALALAKDDPAILDLQIAALGFPALVDEVIVELQHLPAEALVAALFAHLARRDSFSPAEVDAYARVLRSTPGSVAPTARALDEALTRAGRPEGVYWLTKLLALELLRDRGTASEREVVSKFLADPSGYTYERIEYDRRSGEVLRRSPTDIAFAKIAEEALTKMR